MSLIQTNGKYYSNEIISKIFCNEILRNIINVELRLSEMNFTIKYTKIDSGYMGQIMEWPEVVTEGLSMDDCRLMLKDALHEMILAHKQIGLELPLNQIQFESLYMEPEYVR